MSITADAIQKDKQYSVPVAGRPEFVLERGDGVTVYDTEGKAYTDWVAGIAVNSLGYGDRELMDVVAKQMSTGLIHVSGLYHTRALSDLAELLCANSFADKAYFCNSGAEANEGALKFARKLAYINERKNKTNVISFSQAFHGRTLGALSVTPTEKYQTPFKPMVPGAIVGEFNSIDSAKALIDQDTVAVIVEPIQGEGGINLASADFLRALRQLCDENDAVLIFDEIQCGMGRTGDLWAHSSSGVTPDIMTLAKPLAGGLPIGAILVTEEVGSAMQPGDHGSTFSGGAVVMRAGEMVVKRMLSPGFLEHVQEVGEYLLERLSEINSPHITDVRGRGLMAAIELNVPPADIVNQGYEHGLLLVNSGPDALRFIPPLIVEKQHVDELVEKLTMILEGIDVQG
ncbi:MAG: acetylornithine/succinylornithine family transaminase [Chloroflexota bacterium]|nr:acetylornithine/succinylornithine family transaminase [Chloroflexota bacterium]MDE2909490.1 acetylornithine/succinylornithine family transaminase [Chloroflexota bacterium]